jgi:hypothetical protein
MINHARTLLLGEPGKHLEHINTGMPYDAYVPAYALKSIRPGLLDAREAVMGYATDTQARRARAAALLTIIESTTFAEHLYQWDPRKTYDFSRHGATADSSNMVADVSAAVYANGIISEVFRPPLTSLATAYFMLTSHAIFPYRLAGLVLGIISEMEQYHD